MRFRFSRCIAIQTPHHDQAVDFYHRVLGFPVIDVQPGCTELNGDPYRIFIQKGEPKGPILEFQVDDLIAARKTLESHGCTVIRWEGKGKDCYMRDPYGLVFNLWEEPAAAK